MRKRLVNLLMIGLAAVVLIGCSSSKSSSVSSSSTGSQTPSANTTQLTPGGNFDFSKQPIESKLAIGTLALEGTSNAVTAEQAKTLLPLWKAVKSLSTSSTISTDEMNALYQQIQEAMTPDQITAINNLSLKQSDLQALQQKYNVQMPQPGAVPQGTPVARSGSSSGSNTTGGGFPGGDPGGMGMPPDGGAGGPGGMMPGQDQSSGRAQVTPSGTRPAGQGPRGGGMNTMFIDPLIKVLQERAAA